MRSLPKLKKTALALQRRWFSNCRHIVRILLTVAALLTFVVDFVTPTTPTPIAVRTEPSQLLPAVFRVAIAGSRSVRALTILVVLCQVTLVSDSTRINLLCLRRC